MPDPAHPGSASLDATVVGAGPNGLVAAVTMARAGLRVRLVERGPRVGGGMSSAELTLPGFLHDVCSAVHPAALASPFYRAWGLTERVRMMVPEASYAHPFDDRPAAIAYRSMERTVDRLGPDGRAWRRVFAPLVAHLDGVVDFTGHPLVRVPRYPVTAARLGLRALSLGNEATARGALGDTDAAALFAGAAAHTVAPLDRMATAGAGLLLATLGHGAGWPVPVGGSQAIADALAADLVLHGGEIQLNTEIRSRADLEPSTITMLDTSTEFLASFARDDLPAGYRRALRRFRRGNGVAKVDFATSGPIPWSDPAVGESATVHLGGERAAMRAGEAAVAAGRMPDDPYVLLVQPSILDPTRAPDGCHTVWAYTHVPAGSTIDYTEAITAQIERFAPGFRDTILASAHRSAAELAIENPNDAGGEIMGGAVTLRQLIVRPVLSPTPWRTPAPGIYLCSASTPPGPSTHGTNGFLAASTALRDRFGITEVELRDAETVAI